MFLLGVVHFQMCSRHGTYSSQQLSLYFWLNWDDIFTGYIPKHVI